MVDTHGGAQRRGASLVEDAAARLVYTAVAYLFVWKCQGHLGGPIDIPGTKFPYFSGHLREYQWYTSDIQPSLSTRLAPLPRSLQKTPIPALLISLQKNIIPGTNMLQKTLTAHFPVCQQMSQATQVSPSFPLDY